MNHTHDSSKDRNENRSQGGTRVKSSSTGCYVSVSSENYNVLLSLDATDKVKNKIKNKIELNETNKQKDEKNFRIPFGPVIVLLTDRAKKDFKGSA